MSRQGYIGDRDKDSDGSGEENRPSVSQSLRRMQTKGQEKDVRRGGLQIGFSLRDLNEAMDDAKRHEKYLKSGSKVPLQKMETKTMGR